MLHDNVRAEAIVIRHEIEEKIARKLENDVINLLRPRIRACIEDSLKDLKVSMERTKNARSLYDELIISVFLNGKEIESDS